MQVAAVTFTFPAILTRPESEVWCHYRSEHVICLLYFQAAALFSRQQIILHTTESEPRSALLQIQAQHVLATNPGTDECKCSNLSSTTAHIVVKNMSHKYQYEKVLLSWHTNYYTAQNSWQSSHMYQMISFTSQLHYTAPHWTIQQHIYLIKSIHKAYPFGAQFNLKPVKTIKVTVTMYGESVVQSKSTRSWKPVLSIIKRGHQMDGWPLCARLCTHTEISPESNPVQNQILHRLYKRPSDETINQGSLCILTYTQGTHACKKITYTR